MQGIDFSKPVSFGIVSAILKNKEFTQLSLSQEKKVSLGQVNKIVKLLLKKGLIEKGKNGYSVVNSLGIVEVVAKYRRMDDLIVKKIKCGSNKGEVIDWLKGKAVFCLDSALECYEEVDSERVCAYLKPGQKETVLGGLEAMKGNKIPLNIYSMDLSVKPVNVCEREATDKIRTAVDLVCDNSAFAAKKLFFDEWNQKIL